ncbi:MAG: HIT domain-containing protein [Planctomycetes bacterium]|nr:HIT domain-containing protein [Planctomycetota bacterium]
MQTQWAPWRMEYILSDKESGGTRGCVFCDRPRETDRLAENLVLCRGPKAFVIMNRFPYNNGHLLVVPHRHTADLGSLEDAEHLDVARLIGASIDVLREAFRPEGFNLGVNLGHVAGAGVEDHIHWHVVPRWAGDTNFLPVLADVKSIPEHLASTYARLRPGFAARFGDVL